MNLRTKLIGVGGILLALTMAFSMAAPAMADSNGNINVHLDDVGTFTYGLWYTGGRSLTAAEVTTEQGATSTGVTVIGFSDTRTNSPGWTLNISASDFSDGNGHVIPNTGFTVAALPNNANLSCPGTAIPSNPFQVVQRGSTPIQLSSASMLLGANAGRGCSSRIQQINLSLEIPAGTYATDYTSVLTVTLVNQPYPMP